MLDTLGKSLVESCVVEGLDNGNSWTEIESGFLDADRSEDTIT
jgi:hypothetical protein